VGCGRGGVGVWGCVCEKLKKSEQTQKKSTPPIKKILDLLWRGTA